jgi:anti-sigma factor RsiW
MNHQPYEMWILDPPGLSAEQREELEKHLLGCADCRTLREHWTLVQVELRQPQEAAPRYGFTRRWQAGMSERRLRDQRRQAWKFFLACSGSAALVFVLMVAYVLLSTTPVEWVQAGVRAISSSVGVVTTMREITSTWAQVVPPVLSIAFWISVSLTFCILALVWVFALWRTSLGGFIQR